MKRLSPRKSSSLESTETTASSADCSAMSSSSSPRRCQRVRRRREISKRAALRRRPCSRATASSRRAPSPESASSHCWFSASRSKGRSRRPMRDEPALRSRRLPLERLENAGRDLGRTAPFDELDESVQINAGIRPEHRCEPSREAGLGELPTPPGRDRSAVGSVGLENGSHAKLVSDVARSLPAASVVSSRTCARRARRATCRTRRRRRPRYRRPSRARCSGTRA